MKSILQVCFSLTISLALFSSSCHKKCDPPHDPLVLKFPDALRPYIDFGIGSYWVYQDSATGRLDSIVLTAKEWGWDEASALNSCTNKLEVNKRVESLKLFYKEYRNGIFAYDLTAQTRNRNKLDSSINDLITEIDDQDDLYVISHPLQRSTFGHFSSYDITQGFIDSITVNGFLFSDVLEEKAVPSLNANSYYYKSFYKENIGMILSFARDANKSETFYRAIIRYKIK
jgi:hypothetical protein